MSARSSGDPLRPAVGDVAQVERGDVERVSHRRRRGPGRGGALREGVRDRDRERERRSPALLGFHPNRAPVALDDVARDREPKTGPAAGGARAVGLVEALEDARLIGRRDARSPSSATRGASRHRGARAAASPPTGTSVPDGLNFTALWTRFANTCASRAASPRTGGRPGATSMRERDALPIGERSEGARRIPWRPRRGRRRRGGAGGRRSRSAPGRAARQPSAQCCRFRPRACRSARASWAARARAPPLPPRRHAPATRRAGRSS